MPLHTVTRRLEVAHARLIASTLRLALMPPSVQHAALAVNRQVEQASGEGVRARARRDDLGERRALRDLERRIAELEGLVSATIQVG